MILNRLIYQTKNNRQNTHFATMSSKQQPRPTLQVPVLPPPMLRCLVAPRPLTSNRPNTHVAPHRASSSLTSPFSTIAGELLPVLSDRPEGAPVTTLALTPPL